MSEEKFGIEVVQNFIEYGMEYADDIRKAKADGKITFKDTAYFVDNAIKLPKMVKQVNAFVDQVLDISDAENQELRVWFSAKYGVVEDKVDKLIEAALKAGVSVANTVMDTLALVEAIKELKDAGDIK